jgi:Raf kinase inhibitor-like YbhB/YbcL family protein
MNKRRINDPPFLFKHFVMNCILIGLTLKQNNMNSAVITATLVVTSMSFQNNQMIPMKYTCEGESINPQLHIEHVPSGTKTLAIIMHDPDAPIPGGFTHWVAWNIDPNIKDIPENFQQGNQGKNGSGKTGYTGPCPPKGTHHYHFKVYALDSRLDLDPAIDKKGLEKAMKGHILAEGELIGLYKKTK